MRLAILPIGAYEPRQLMESVHIDPAHAVQAHLDLRAGTSLGVHWGTFAQTDEGRDTPIEDLKSALEAQRVPLERFWVLNPGEARDVP